MAVQTKRIAFTIDVDEEAVAPASVNVFIYRLLNELGQEHDIKSVTVDGVTVAINSREDLYNLPLGENQDLTKE
jgi:hypothetical protein